MPDDTSSMWGQARGELRTGSWITPQKEAVRASTHHRAPGGR
jgi:hypothetical protein